MEVIQKFYEMCDRDDENGSARRELFLLEISERKFFVQLDQEDIYDSISQKMFIRDGVLSFLIPPRKVFPDTWEADDTAEELYMMLVSSADGSK